MFGPRCADLHLIRMRVSVIAQRHPGIHPLLQQSGSLIDLARSMQLGFDHETKARGSMCPERTQNRCRRPLRFGQEVGPTWVDEEQVVNRDADCALGARPRLIRGGSAGREQRDQSGYALHSRLPHILWSADPPAAYVLDHL